MEHEYLYKTFVDYYKRTGRIGRTKPQNLEHAKKIAYSAATRICNKHK
jgi:hypothetical protein